MKPIRIGKLYQTNVDLWGSPGCEDGSGVNVPKDSVVLFIKRLPDQPGDGWPRCNVIFEDQLIELIGPYSEWLEKVKR